MTAHSKKEAKTLIAEVSDGISGVLIALDAFQQHASADIGPVQTAQCAHALAMVLEGCQKRLVNANLLLD